MAFSHCGLAWRKTRAGPIEASSATPISAAPEGPSAAGDRHPAHDDRGDDLELEAGAGVGVDGGEADGVEQGSQSGQGAHHDEDVEHDPTRADAGQPRGLGVRSGRVDGPPGREVTQAPGERGEDQ